MITVTNPKTKKLLIALFIIFDLICVALLLRFVVFKDQFENWGAGLTRLSEWKEDYKAKNADATEEEADAELEKSLADLKLWREQYKSEHPDATQEDIDRAWSEAWGK